MKREELIEKLKTKSIPLSYSWLKNFTSPINFLNYKLEPKKQNAGMKLGSVCDMLLLTPDQFDDKFAIVENAPTTDKQQDFANDVLSKFIELEGEEPTADQLQEIYSKHYSRGTYEKTYNTLKDYIFAVMSNKDLIDRETYEKAVELKDKLLAFP